MDSHQGKKRAEERFEGAGSCGVQGGRAGQKGGGWEEVEGKETVSQKGRPDSIFDRGPLSQDLGRGG